MEIARCPVITSILAGEPSPCRAVVSFQKRALADRWTAEPWSGHLEEAPILFISSNPSAGNPDEPPVPGDLTFSSDDDEILHTFVDAFEDGPWIGISNGTHQRSADGRIGDYIAYWGSCRARAAEILDRPVEPGRDYALTEVVHCGSKHEIGVWPAAAECVPRYLQRVLQLSPAVVIVVVGAVARDIIRAMFPQTASGGPHLGPLSWAGHDRHILFLPHPNARGMPKGVVASLGYQADIVLTAIRSTLATKP